MGRGQQDRGRRQRPGGTRAGAITAALGLVLTIVLLIVALGGASVTTTSDPLPPQPPSVPVAEEAEGD